VSETSGQPAELDDALRLMRDARTIAVVGASSDPRRPSNDVSRYLIDAGYTVYFVNPNEETIFDQPVYDSLEEVPEPVDIVDVFRRSEHVPPVVDDAIAAGASAVWMQLAITHDEAAAKARAAGLEVVMDRCTKIEHRRLRGLGVRAAVDGDGG
jgi:predicted CoA-binding protein